MHSTLSGVTPMGASRGAIRAARFGAAVFLPLAFACVGLLGIFIGPTVTTAVRHVAMGDPIDHTMTGSILPAMSGYGVDDTGQ